MTLGRLTLRLWWRVRYWTLAARVGGARWSLVLALGPLTVMWAR